MASVNSASGPLVHRVSHLQLQRGPSLQAPGSTKTLTVCERPPKVPSQQPGLVLQDETAATPVGDTLRDFAPSPSPCCWQKASSHRSPRDASISTADDLQLPSRTKTPAQLPRCHRAFLRTNLLAQGDGCVSRCHVDREQLSSMMRRACDAVDLATHVSLQPKLL